MENFLIGMFVGVVVTAIAIRIALHLAVKRAERTIESLTKAIEQLKLDHVAARVEEHQGVFYVYNATDNSFMAQGATLAELRATIEARWSDRRVLVTEGEPEVLDRLRATKVAADA